MTGRLPGPTPRALCAGFEGDRRRRLARDRGSRVGLSRGGSPPPCGARGTHAGAPARRRGTRGGRARGARGRACGRGRRGTRGCIRVGSRRRTTPGETTPGTPCSEVEGGVGRSSGGTTRRRSPGGRQGAERGAGWVTIPPGAEHRPAGGVDHESAVKWLTTGPPLKCGGARPTRRRPTGSDRASGRTRPRSAATTPREGEGRVCATDQVA